MKRPTPFPHQIDGADHLQNSMFHHAGLFDAPRVGKTGAALMAASQMGFHRILVVTTASGRSVWHQAVPQWTKRRAVVVRQPADWKKIEWSDEIVIVAWSGLNSPVLFARLLAVRWDLIIADESHYCKNPDAKRTQRFYGRLIADGAQLDQTSALVGRADRVWCLSGTPAAHDSSDIYPMLRALAPRVLEGRGDFPNVMRREDFDARYTARRRKQISQFRSILIKTGSLRGQELGARMKGFGMRRTQQDVGIQLPIYETVPFFVSDADRAAIEIPDGKVDVILAAIRRGETRDLDMHLGPLRRLTAALKCPPLIEYVSEEFEGGLDRIVLAYWHRQVGDLLAQGLALHGVARIDGATSYGERLRAVADFNSGKARVFLAQIEAAGEAIDLSAAAVLVFVEQVFSPRSMSQCALRITNLNQRRTPIVRVAVIEDSIDEAVEASLMALWAGVTEFNRTQEGDQA